MKPLVWLACAPIRFYRRWISPLKPPTCRFHPTCSTYALEALERHGLLRGTALAVWRILRCQPFGKGGLDPVPPVHGTRACSGAGEVDTVTPRSPAPRPEVPP